MAIQGILYYQPQTLSYHPGLERRAEMCVVRALKSVFIEEICFFIVISITMRTASAEICFYCFMQVGFIKFIVAPTFHATSLLLHKMTGTVNASLDHNMAYWKRLEDTQKRISDSKIALGFGKKFGGGLASQRGSSRSLTGSAGSNGGSSSNLTKSFKKY
jgi:hypothetical protein